MSSCSARTIRTISGAALRIVGQVAVRHDVNVGLDVGEHPADDAAFALLSFRSNDRARSCRDFARPVAAIVVVDVDGRFRQRLAKALDGRADRRFLVVARQKHGDARLLLCGHHPPGHVQRAVEALPVP